MIFMNDIKETECRFKRYVREYNGQPIVILGGGKGAKGIIRYLREHGIYEFKVCVDEKYWQKDQFIEGIPIEKLETVLGDTREKYDLVIGYFDCKMDSMDKYMALYPKAINKIIYEDIFPHFWMEPQIFIVDRYYYEQYDVFLTELYNNLADEYSRRVLHSFIEQRISGDFKYASDVLSNLSDEYLEPDLINAEGSYAFIDCGAFDGEDSKRFFKRFTNNHSCAFLIEPDLSNVDLINKNLGQEEYNYTVINKAIWNENKKLSFSAGGGEGSGINVNGDTYVQSICIDSLYDEYHQKFDNRIGIVKMDIEGTELRALQGARRFIEEQWPILVICVYHKPEDIIELPRFIMELNHDYKLSWRKEIVS